MMKKGTFLLGIVMLLVCVMPLLTACQQAQEDPQSVLESIAVTQQPARTTYVRGDVFENAGLKVGAKYTGSDDFVDVTDKIKVPTEPLTYAMTKVTVSYTEGDITKTVDIAVTVTKLPPDTLVLDSIPDTALTVEADANGKTAKAYWFAEYGETGAKITAFVTDEEIKASQNMSLSDHVEFLISTAQRLDGGISEDTVLVSVASDGRASFKKYESGQFEPLDESGIEAEGEIFSFGDEIDGYRIIVSVPYSDIQASLENKDMTLCVALCNVNGGDIRQKTSDLFGMQQDASQTYIAVTASNTFAKNKYYYYGATFGDAGAYKTNAAWDLTNDNPGIDADERSARMTGTTTTNEYPAYMHGSSATNFYAEAEFNVIDRKSGEKAGKFGFYIVTESGDGLLLYVAANHNDTSFTGVSFGRAYRHNGVWSSSAVWSTPALPNAGTYQGENYVKLGVYRRNGTVDFYFGDTRIVENFYADYGLDVDTPAYVGIISLGLQIQVKAQRHIDAGNDPDSLLESYQGRKTPIADQDFLFVGDGRFTTGNWSTYNAFAGDLGGTTRNIGTAGTTLANWNNRARIMGDLYTARHVIVNAGITDINDKLVLSAAAFEALARETVMRYKQAFPDATIYFITVIPHYIETYADRWPILKEANDLICAWDIPGVKVIDVVEVFGIESYTDMAQYCKTGNLHLNADGYARLQGAIKEALGII
ncbi:MAG: SGNH/GDSL hydrolase family protein [Clostridiales bacterium]|jgi:lysophospholipase L1-like esterase|nr:SGNH/GDSL hydrolase family protein [Clostridiales bacterium]